MKLFNELKKIIITYKEASLSSAKILLGTKNSSFNFLTLLRTATYLFSTIYVSKYLYILFVERKTMKNGKKNFNFFPNVVSVPLILIIAVEIFYSVIQYLLLVLEKL